MKRSGFSGSTDVGGAVPGPPLTRVEKWRFCVGTGEKVPRAGRVLHQAPETWAPSHALLQRHDENLDRLLVESIQALAARTGLQVCVTFSRQPWLDCDGRALPIARREWFAASTLGFDLLWWVNPAARLFYCFARKPTGDDAAKSEPLFQCLPAVNRLLAEELAVTHPLRSVRLAIEALSIQLPDRTGKVEGTQAPSQRA